MSSLDGCDFGDIHCYKVKWVISDLQLAMAQNDLGAARRKIDTLVSDLASAKGLIGSMGVALQQARNASDGLAKQVGIPWYWSPWLWGPLGAAIATTVIIGCLEGLKALR